MTLPELRTGIYRHYKGQHYLVLGYAHDANADNLVYASDQNNSSVRVPPIEERFVVVYVGLELSGAHTGPRMAVRSVDDFFAWLHADDFSVCHNVDYVQARPEYPVCVCAGSWWREGYVRRNVVKRFDYVGPSWDGARPDGS